MGNIVWTVQSGAHQKLHTSHNAHYKLHTANSTLQTAHCTLHIAHCTLHTAHCTLHTAHHTQGRGGGAADRVLSEQLRRFLAARGHTVESLGLEGLREEEKIFLAKSYPVDWTTSWRFQYYPPPPPPLL